jgi:hypothetical protein
MFELAIPMEEGMTKVRGSEKHSFYKVHGNDENMLIKRGGFMAPSNPKRLVYFGSSSIAKTTKNKMEHGLCEVL